MKPESEAITEQIQAIIRDKANELSSDDLLDIDMLKTKLDLEDSIEIIPWIEEAIALIVNAPEYEGDIVFDE